MSLKEDREDFKDYITKSKIEPDPVEGSGVWRDDPWARKENYPRKDSLKDRKKRLKKKRKVR